MARRHAGHAARFAAAKGGQLGGVETGRPGEGVGAGAGGDAGGRGTGLGLGVGTGAGAGDGAGETTGGGAGGLTLLRLASASVELPPHPVSQPDEEAMRV